MEKVAGGRAERVECGYSLVDQSVVFYISSVSSKCDIKWGTICLNFVHRFSVRLSCNVHILPTLLYGRIGVVLAGFASNWTSLLLLKISN